MPESHARRFDEVLDAVESLPEEQQESLIDILRRRQVERRREDLAAAVVEARRELAQGAVRRGSVEELLDEL